MMSTTLRRPVIGLLSLLHGVALAAHGGVAPAPGARFRDCARICPELVALAPARFEMASSSGAPRTVRIDYPLAISRGPVTRAQYAAFVGATHHVTASAGCLDLPAAPRAAPGPQRTWERPGFRQSPDDPVVCVSWHDARAYADWLSDRTGHRYRLPSEAEWELATRAAASGTGGRTRTAMPVRAWQWLEDCRHDTDQYAPVDGSAWTTGDCAQRLRRAGTGTQRDAAAATAARAFARAGHGAVDGGFHVVRETLSESPLDRSLRTEWAGNWVSAGAGAPLDAAERPAPSDDPAVQAFTERALADRRALRRDPGYVYNALRCLPRGMPLDMGAAGTEFEILPTTQRLTMLFENGFTRRIWTDGRPHPDDPDPTFAGHSIGHWEGATLVVDTLGITDQAELGPYLRETGKTHVVERMTLVAPNSLRIDTRVTDDDLLSRPWVYTRQYRRIDYPVIEALCQSNNRDGVGSVDLKPPE